MQEPVLDPSRAPCRFPYSNRPSYYLNQDNYLENYHSNKDINLGNYYSNKYSYLGNYYSGNYLEILQGNKDYSG